MLKTHGVADVAGCEERYCVEDFVLSLFRMSGGVEVVEVVAQKRGHYSLFAKMSIHRHANERERARERANRPYIGVGRKKGH